MSLWSSLTGGCASGLRDEQATDEIYACFLLCLDVSFDDVGGKRLHCLYLLFGPSRSLKKLPSLFMLALRALHFSRKAHTVVLPKQWRC